MENALQEPVLASALAARLGARWQGEDCPLMRVAPLGRASDGCLTFSKRVLESPRADRAVVLAPPGSPATAGAVIEVDVPRLAFAKALHLLAASPGFASTADEPELHPEAVISPHAVIGRGVRIGRGSRVGPFVSIADGVQIGEDCLIKPGAVLGEPGYGFERDVDGIPIRIIHLGKLLIGNRVEIGSQASICAGTLDDTVIEDDVKIDDQVHVSHNCRIRRGAMLVACVELSGGVDVGPWSWIGPNSAVLQKLHIGEGAYIGLGVNVLRDVTAGHTVAGYPGRSLGPRNAEA